MYTTMEMKPIFIKLNPIQFFLDELPLILLVPILFLVWMNYPFWWGLYVPLIFGCILLLLIRFLYLKNILFEITDQQIKFSHGLFTKSTEYIELYRIVDYAEHSSLIQKMYGLKTVTVISTDKTSPTLQLKGIDTELDIIPVLRLRSELNKKRMGVYEIANR